MTAVRLLALLLVMIVAPAWAHAQSEGDEPGKAEKSKKRKKKGKGKNKGKDKDKAPAEAADDQPADGEQPSATALPPEGGDVSSPVAGDAPVGAEENPRAPVTDFNRPAQVEAKAPAPVSPTGYPIERALRPITLPRRMTEVTLDLPNTFNPYVQSGLIGVRHGITAQIQAGLRYGTGTISDGDFIAGKTFSIDGEYQVFHWLAAQLAVPIMVDPFSAGVTVGAPMKFTLFDRLRFDLFRDFLTFKLTRFAPSVVDAAYDDAQAELDRTNTVLDDGEINLNAGATWQLQPQMALEGRLGLKGRDFEFQSDSPTAFDVGLIYSSSNMVDIGGRMGFADLNHTDASFGLWLLAALRL